MASTVRALVIEAFKLEGLVLESAGRDLVDQHVSAIRNTKSRQQELARIVEHVSSNPELSSAKVSTDLIEEAIRVGQDSEAPAEDDVLVLDHKSLPVTIYDPLRKTFSKQPASTRAFHSAERPLNRIQALRERFQLVHQRVLSHSLFRKPAVLQTNSEYRELTPISSLRRTHGEVCAVLGLLTQPREGGFCLEDCSHSIEVEMTEETLASAGLFTENCVVLAEGEMQGDKFRIDVLAMPPVEERSETCKKCPSLSTPLEQSSRSQGSEKLDERTSIIVLSDVWLDRPKVQTGLRLLFSKFNSDCIAVETAEDQKKYIFVLMGDFTSQPAPCGYESHRSAFDQLGRLIKTFPALVACSSFVVMPGPNDVLGGGGRVLPRQAFADVVTADLARHVPDSFVFTSNPCRIKFYSQEIVLFRDDICATLRRYSRRPQEQRTEADNALHSHAIKTMFSQSHLCPLPLEAGPIDWAHDHALRLYPLPHVLLLGCRGREFSCVERHVRVANPSCFATDFSFAVYSPFVGEYDARLGREYQGELDVFTLDVGAVDRQTALDRARDDPSAGGAAPKRRRRAAPSADGAATTKRQAPRESGVPAEAAEVGGGDAAGQGFKTPREKTTRKKHTPMNGKEMAAVMDKSQMRIGSFFMPNLAAAAGGDMEGDDMDDTVAAVDGEVRDRRRKRLSQVHDSDDESQEDSEEDSPPEAAAKAAAEEEEEEGLASDAGSAAGEADLGLGAANADAGGESSDGEGAGEEEETDDGEALPAAARPTRRKRIMDEDSDGSD